jgi:hypothetical protein
VRRILVAQQPPQCPDLGHRFCVMLASVRFLTLPPSR